ncbi:MAG TPA: right-handed parallel beta-helix repeat-containing protein [Gemmatimonadales bacterium]|nr:right-handed parallel beta-helix repeat-containing protein [Gemmatimonadales bacterium]
MRAILPVLLVPTLLAAQQRAVPYTPGMVITASTRIAPGSYLAPSSERAAMTIEGDNITVDLQGVELVGTSDRSRPDRFSGTGIRVIGGNKVTVRGGAAHGYKVALHATGTHDLILRDLDLSYNWKPRLMSGIEKESLVDWMSFHQNDKNEWLAKGAAIYLDGVTGGEVKGVTARQGLNGLLMTRTTHLKIWNNDFSYNSGLGIGMYRSSDNRIMHNRIDYNVRGYSHGFYNRGQDSAGLLMYEQCNNNVVAYNSVTHSGDGLFIWAGQSTMDSGEGGVNDNLFYGNDFSHAPTNGIENTFSRNVFVNNRVEENWHGVWGGYSYQTIFLGNRFINNDEAITIEHGQEIRITGNTFSGDTTAIRIWQNPTEPADWGYPQHRDTRSRDYTILGNQFTDVQVAVQATDSRNVRIAGNTFRNVDTLTRTKGDTTGWRFISATKGRAAPVEIPARYRVARLPGGQDAMIPRGTPRGRKTIIVDEWGPYDWQSPKLWPVGPSDATPQQLRVLGPTGTWRVVGLEGVVSLSAESGNVGDTLTVVPTGGRENDWRVELEYSGTRPFVTRFGEPIPANQPFRFSWQRFQPEIAWHLDFRPAPDVPFDSTARIVATLDTNRLDLTWYQPPNKAIPQANVRTQATAEVTLAPGRYRLRTIVDDAVWVFLDGKLILEDPGPGESRVTEVEFEGGGTHRLLVNHYQKDGWYELRVDIERVR